MKAKKQNDKSSQFIVRTGLIKIGLPLLLTIVWGIMASKTFNEKPDLNGDNFCYYIFSTSLATGHGYADLSKPDAPPTATFPPGYPILMTPLRMMTDSIVAQKWLNEIFVLAGVLLLFFILLRLDMRWDISLAAAIAGLFCPRLWHFSTMMMSEASFFFTSILVFYALIRLYPANEKTTDKKWYDDLKNPWLWVMIIVLVFNYHIRTQGLALLAAIILCLLIGKHWTATATTIIGFIVGCLPYMLRNRLLGLNGNRYMDTIMLSNPFQPEAGTLTLGEVVVRFFQTLKMLIFNAIPNTIFPYLNVNCDAGEYSAGIYIIGALVFIVILIGCWSMGKLRWAALGYLAATLGLISIFSTPSGNRYITSILPLLAAGLFCGIWQIVKWCFYKRREWLVQGTALILCLMLIASKNGINQEIEQSKQKYPINYVQFFNLGKQLKKTAPAGTIVCSRKPQMFWLKSQMPGVSYLFTSDRHALIADLIDKKVDYVVLDALGYGSTPMYLFPAVQEYGRYFQIVTQYDNTHTYLLKFNRERAATDFENEN